MMPGMEALTKSQIARLDVMLDEARRTVESVLPRERVEFRTIDAPAMMMFSRTRRLYRACVTSLRADLADEAMILGRSIFTESLRLGEMADAGDDRVQFAVRWFSDGINVSRDLLKVAEDVGLETDLSASLAQLEERRRQLDAFVLRNGVQRHGRAFGDEKQMAVRQGRTHEYWVFVLAHQMTHGSEVGYANQDWRNPPERPIADTPSTPVQRANTGSWILSCYLRGFLSMATMFGWDRAPAQTLLDEVDRLSA
jgi:hypothetical protein